MICSHCGRFVHDGSLTCEYCHAYLGKYSGDDSGSPVRAIRQGRSSSETGPIPDTRQQPPKEIGDYDMSSLPSGRAAPEGRSPRRGTPAYRGRESASPTPAYSAGDKAKRKISSPKFKAPHKRSRINWALIVLIVAILGIGAFTAYTVYMKTSDEGQRITARKYILSATDDEIQLAQTVTSDADLKQRQEELVAKWSEIDPDAYWDEGQNYMSYGDMAASVKAFQIADVVDPDNYDGLMLLANVYELSGQESKAELVYQRLITSVRPDRGDAYSSLVNLYKNQGREQDAADLMQLAYEQTGKETFRLLRQDYIPSMPVVDLAAGRYELTESGLRYTRKNQQGEIETITKVVLSSEEGFDVYYTTDENAILPEEGRLVERCLNEDGTMGYEGIEVTEGTLTIRAVAVSGNLCSDEFEATYVFYYPTPPAPYANLASGTYNKLHSVSLKAGINADDTLTKKELAEKESHYTYYYTIDGSTPTTNSPMYDGTPIKLPSGRVTLKAICVNQYGKSSSILEIGYKFTVKPYLPLVYSEEDTFGDFVLNKTTLDQFTAAFGTPEEKLNACYYSTAENAQHLEYPWGHAVFSLSGKTWYLVRVEMKKAVTTCPRDSGFGMTEEEIVALFRDYGQPSNKDDTRNLYYSYPDVGQVLFKEDGTRYIQYRTETAAGKTWMLEFYLKDGKVNRIVNYNIP